MEIANDSSGEGEAEKGVETFLGSIVDEVSLRLGEDERGGSGREEEGGEDDGDGNGDTNAKGDLLACG